MSGIDRSEAVFRTLSSATVVITGGANGIGASTARLFHTYGAKVVIADLPSTRDSAISLISSLPETSRDRIVYIPTDILDWGSLTNVFKFSITKFGRVDIVIANAGMMESKPFFDEDDVDESGDLREPSQSHYVIDVNLKGTMNSKSAYYCFNMIKELNCGIQLFALLHTTCSAIPFRTRADPFVDLFFSSAAHQATSALPLSHPTSPPNTVSLVSFVPPVLHSSKSIASALIQLRRLRRPPILPVAFRRSG